ncbi:YveK family protein [Sutcliffiella rhizosphaerae]|uniref:Capsular polysaccharide biosynthesis protein YwqC n=1 Tax=Sutcliffiella rhizosphaerae TaxID=2880967 RepID=A0ABM8YJT0_9BACI|nr:Wzz/FepE/Etk N-terminal domain-containing protein [Sutcliffiella rhizosphaerae]CAG9620190.1 putative capsular polysaccharide biosynthesis protein YwqC [Sutcliffiella rhizosphaerae]
MEETISLKELFHTIRKRLWLIVLITAIFTTLSGLVSYFLITPIYQSQAQLLVNQEKADQTSYNTGDIQANIQLINTYNVIIKSRTILDIVSSELNNTHTSSQLTNMITVGSVQNSQVLTITVENPDPVMAANIANTTALVFQEQVVNIMNVDNVNILTPAQVGENPSPIKPQPVLNMAIAFVVGMMVGVGLAFLLEFLDNTVKTEQDIEKLLGLPVIGTITLIEEKDIQEAQKIARKVARTRGETVGS